MNKVAAVVDRETGKILKGRCDEVVLCAHPDTGRVGIEA
jgi:hypothetical protein